MEAMMLKTPALVNGECPVLKSHCLTSNGGLWFSNYTEFEMTLNWMLSHPQSCEIMGENGKKYVESKYQWDVISSEINSLIQKVLENNDLHSKDAGE